MYTFNLFNGLFKFHIYEKQKLYERRTPRKSFSSEDEWTSLAAVKIKLRELLFCPTSFLVHFPINLSLGP